MNTYSGENQTITVTGGSIPADEQKRLGLAEVRREVQLLEAEVLRAAREWGKELQRINSTTYTRENAEIAVFESFKIIRDPVRELLKFEDAQR